MKFKWLTFMLVTVMSLAVVAAPPSKYARQKSTAATSTDQYIDVNKILMFVSNVGNIAYDASKMFGQNDGLYYPYTSVDDILSGVNYDKHVIFDAGLWIGGVDSATNDTLVSVAEYSTEFGPGSMIGGHADTASNATKYRVYKLYSDSMSDTLHNQDYADWPVDQGAPVDSLGKPKLTGNQMAWSVYNDEDPANHTNVAGKTAGLGVEVQQTVFAYNREDAMGNIVFVKYKLINKGARTLKDVFASIWSDPDLGGATDDLVGCDTTLSLGFCYNATNADAKYGSKPPAVGIDFFQGPLEYTGVSTDTGKMWGHKYAGYINQPMSSFDKYINGTDPKGKTQTYDYMQGLNADGSAYEYNGKAVKFFHSGDPVTGVGDLDSDPADRRLMLSTGPFTLRPFDSTEILAAIICGQGSDRLTSISAMKYYDVFAQDSYNRDFNLPNPPAAPRVKVVTYDGEVNLSWDNISETDHGDYPFEGYTVLQGVSAAGPWTNISGANFDIRNGIGVIFDNVFDIDKSVVINEPVKFGSDPGVHRWFSATKDYITNNPLYNASDYFYRVEAYSFDNSQTPKTLTSATVVKAIPQKPIPEKRIPYAVDNVLPVDHHGRTDGTRTSDGTVVPQVINPDSLTGDQYRVTFAIDTVPNFFIDTTIEIDSIYAVDTIFDTTYVGDSTHTDSLVYIRTIVYDTTKDTTYQEIYDTAFNVYWTLRDLTKDTILYNRMFNQGATADVREDYAIFDGMIVHVYGPNPGLKVGEPGDADAGWAAIGTRHFTQLGGATAIGYEGFRGTAGWAGGPNGFFAGQGVKADRLRNVELRLAGTDSIGQFNPTDSNVSYAYRYLRRNTDPPAQPGFIPYIINTTGGYAFQDFIQSVPLSAWDIDANPPRRLAIGFLENNRPHGTVDGRYWPPAYNDVDSLRRNNYDVEGPREWLFIFDTAYATTVSPAMAVDILDEAYTPIMYHTDWEGRFNGLAVPVLDSTMSSADSAKAIAAAAAERASASWKPGDRFQLFANHINYITDTFFFSGVKPSSVASGSDNLKGIKVVPNPYYLFASYDRSVYNRRIQFINLPAKCTISIFTLAGDRVAVINKDDVSTSLAEWNMLTDNQVPVASGIYVYVVDAPGFGQKVGKMAIFTEQEQLGTY